MAGLRIDIITVQPGLLKSPFEHSIISRAQSKGMVEIHLHQLRDFATNAYRQTDDYPYGGGAGMVLMAEPLARCIDQLKRERHYDEIIYLCPDGEMLKQKIANRLSLKQNLMMICGHYKGIDERIRQHYVTLEISIGDYVLTGGELAAAVLTDAIIRLIPGVISDEESALSDSFQDGLLAPPVYTRPAEWRGHKVPEELLSGDPKIVDNWRLSQALERTRARRPDLLNDSE